jgi:thioredoxin reductase (NADPH)
MIKARAAIIATGVRRRKLGIPGEDEFTGRGIITSGAKNRDTIAGKRVAIVGGGDAAIENAIILSERAEKVYVIHRKDALRARQEFADKARERQNVEFLFETRLAAIQGSESVESVVIENAYASERRKLDVDAVLIRIGIQPNSELVSGQLELDKNGYIVVNSRCETSKPNVYAVGDVASANSPTIVSAAGMGATAVKTLFSQSK